jgi:hypothetical protein
VREWERRVGGAVDHERRYHDRRDRLGRNVALRDHALILGGGDVTRALDVVADESLANVVLLNIFTTDVDTCPA